MYSNSFILRSDRGEGFVVAHMVHNKFSPGINSSRLECRNIYVQKCTIHICHRKIILFLCSWLLCFQVAIFIHFSIVGFGATFFFYLFIVEMDTRTKQNRFKEIKQKSKNEIKSPMRRSHLLQ